MLFTLLSPYPNVLIFQSNNLVIKKKDVHSNNLPAVRPSSSARQQLRKHLELKVHHGQAGTPLMFPRPSGSG